MLLNVLSVRAGRNCTLFAGVSNAARPWLGNCASVAATDPCQVACELVGMVPAVLTPRPEYM
ncbi:hypothetical protein GCM10007901_06490 [Dyella acidisoli]|uniref:Uncharacterized protein n=1 Tax=Dyella acidisoli TaxID=1867834 RepID=A0ABQ5XMR6_9GAMM|nr:hypothetical protein GCM10007901_06490 [Dyella acidisoli]